MRPLVSFYSFFFSRVVYISIWYTIDVSVWASVLYNWYVFFSFGFFDIQICGFLDFWKWTKDLDMDYKWWDGIVQNVCKYIHSYSCLINLYSKISLDLDAKWFKVERMCVIFVFFCFLHFSLSLYEIFVGFSIAFWTYCITTTQLGFSHSFDIYIYIYISIFSEFSIQMLSKFYLDLMKSSTSLYCYCRFCFD